MAVATVEATYLAPYRAGMTFGEKLRRLRKAAGEISEAKLAELSGVSFSALREYVMGRRKPPFYAVVKIAAALGKDCRAFADCEDIGPKHEP